MIICTIKLTIDILLHTLTLAPIVSNTGDIVGWVRMWIASGVVIHGVT